MAAGMGPLETAATSAGATAAALTSLETSGGNTQGVPVPGGQAGRREADAPGPPTGESVTLTEHSKPRGTPAEEAERTVFEPALSAEGKPYQAVVSDHNMMQQMEYH